MSMKLQTVLNTGPGFYAAATDQSDSTVPPGKVRFYIARIEAYDGVKDEEGADTEFKLLPAMAEDNPVAARALIRLHHALGQNLALLRHFAQL